MPEGDAIRLRGRFAAVCIGADGAERWREEKDNLVVLTGRNAILDAALRGSGYTAAHYVGLKASGTVDGTDTMLSHPGWTELANYSNPTRPALTMGAASGGVIASSPASAFAINADGTVAGCFVTTSDVKSGTAGTLIAATDFALARAVVAGDTLNVTYQLALL